MLLLINDKKYWSYEIFYIFDIFLDNQNYPNTNHFDSTCILINLVPHQLSLLQRTPMWIKIIIFFGLKLRAQSLYLCSQKYMTYLGNSLFCIFFLSVTFDIFSHLRYFILNNVFPLINESHDSGNASCDYNKVVTDIMGIKIRGKIQFPCWFVMRRSQ